MQFPDAGHPRLSRGHIRFPGGWLLQRGTEHAPPPPFSPATGDSRGWREPTPHPTLWVVNDRLYAAIEFTSATATFLTPYTAESSRNKCVQRFISCAKPKQNFHTSSSNSGGAPVLGGEDGTVAGTLVPSPGGPEAPEGACREPTGRFGGWQGGCLSVRACVRGDKGSRVVVPPSRLTLRLWPQRGGSGPGSLWEAAAFQSAEIQLLPLRPGPLRQTGPARGDREDSLCGVRGEGKSKWAQRRCPSPPGREAGPGALGGALLRECRASVTHPCAGSPSHFPFWANLGSPFMSFCSTKVRTDSPELERGEPGFALQGQGLRGEPALDRATTRSSCLC